MKVLSLGWLEKLFTLCRNPAYLSALCRHGVAAATEHGRVLHAIPANTVIDIGANKGQFALAVRRCRPMARIVSLEPLSGPAGKFRAVFKGDLRVELHEIAIGPRDGDATIHISARDDSSSLLPISANQSALFPGTVETGTATIRVRPLSAVVGADKISVPALLKLDVQGFELEALRGCEDLLDRFEWVYAECSFVELYSGQALADEVIAWLRERKLFLVGVCNMSYDKSGMPVQGDFLFARKPVTSALSHSHTGLAFAPSR